LLRHAKWLPFHNVTGTGLLFQWTFLSSFSQRSDPQATTDVKQLLDSRA
jgi:hypothetical protein